MATSPIQQNEEESIGQNGQAKILTFSDYVPEGEMLHVCQLSGAKIIERMLNDLIDQNEDEILKDLKDRIKTILDTECPDLLTEDPQAAKLQAKNMARIDWYMLERVPVYRIPQLFQNHLEYFFDAPWDVVYDLLQTPLLVEPVPEKRDEIKKEIQVAIGKSPATLGTQMIKLGNTQEQQPTIANWMRDWKDFVRDKKESPLMIVEYLGNSENVKKLSTEDKDRIEHLLKFYLELYKSSLTPEGAEEQLIVADPVLGRYMRFKKGEMIDTGADIEPNKLQALRFGAGLDEHGKPMSLAEQTRLSPLYQPDGTALPTEPMVSLPSNQPKPILPALDELPVPPAVPPSMPEPIMPKATPEPVPIPPKSVRTSKNNNAVSADDAIYRTVAQRVLGVHKILFDELDLEKRFISIITAYLKGTHSAADARQLLTQSPEGGGTNLPMAQIGPILESADHLLAQEQASPIQSSKQVSAENPSIAKPSFDVVSKYIEEQKKQERNTYTQVAKSTTDSADRLDENVEDIFANVSPILEQVEQQVKEENANYSTASDTQKDILAELAEQGVDVPEVMGPVDELKMMSLTEFRHLAPSVGEASKKVLEKIALLEQESLEKKAEGIRAWQSSPLNQMYLKIGNKSLEKGVPIPEAIALLEAEGVTTLTQPEFQVIADLNSQIRY